MRHQSACLHTSSSDTREGGVNMRSLEEGSCYRSQFRYSLPKMHDSPSLGPIGSAMRTAKVKITKSSKEASLRMILSRAITENNQTVAHILYRRQDMAQAISSLHRVLNVCREVLAEQGRKDEQPIERTREDISQASRATVRRMLNICIAASSSSCIANAPNEELDATCQDQHHQQQWNTAGAAARTPRPGRRRSQGQVLSLNTRSEQSPNAGLDRCNPSYILDKPIVVPFDLQRQNCAMSDLCTLLVVVATYNIALAHQLLAQDPSIATKAESNPSDHEDICEEGNKYPTTTKQQRHTLLEKAVRLYEICLLMSVRGGHGDVRMDGTPQDDAGLFDLVTSNNLGAACKQLDNTIKARKCFGYANSVLVCLVEQSLQEVNDNIGTTASIYSVVGLEQEDIDGLFENFWWEVMESGSAAPAA